MKLTYLALFTSLSFQAMANAGGQADSDVFSPDDSDIEHISISGRDTSLLGRASTASEGIVGKEDIKLRPILRTGEILEFVPGMVVTQHSGTGKANQYFLRGFNLDHGTDFATFVDGMPVNMRTHGHGQGYTDLNFIIPEVVQTLSYQKGVSYADVGDFSGAGSASFHTLSKTDKGLMSATLGENNYVRLMAMDSFAVSDKDTLFFAAERNTYDGPWTDIEEDLDKTNVLAKWNRELEDGHFELTFMGYDNSWNSADQIPGRAVDEGIIDALGSLDTTVGGESDRYSLSADYRSGNFTASAYVISYSMNLWSNFTYFLDDPENGDQFEQVDDRTIYGGNAAYTFEHKLFGRDASTRVGGELRIDDIDEVGLYHTAARQRLGAIRSDSVTETSIGAFVENTIHWTSDLRTVIGLRNDYFDFDVDDRIGVNANGVDLSANSGSNDDNMTSVKGSVIYTVNDNWETYLSAGQGLHSNDARGTTINVDPGTGEAVEQVDPLVRSTGMEAGLRGFISDTLNVSVSLWQLKLDSELLFVGDAGNTEASRASKRKGAELALYYRFAPDWMFDFEYAYTDAEFTDDAPEGNYIPGAIKNVLQTGVSVDLDSGLFGSLRARYFGGRPLIEDGSVSSDNSTIVNLRAGYRVNDWTFQIDVLNLTDSDAHDIDYYYASRLQSDPAGAEIEGQHYHIIEPRTVRASVMYQF